MQVNIFKRNSFFPERVHPLGDQRTAGNLRAVCAPVVLRWHWCGGPGERGTRGSQVGGRVMPVNFVLAIIGP